MSIPLKDLENAGLLEALRAYHAGADRGELKTLLCEAWGPSPTDAVQSADDYAVRPDRLRPVVALHAGPQMRQCPNTVHDGCCERSSLPVHRRPR